MLWLELKKIGAKNTQIYCDFNTKLSVRLEIALSYFHYLNICKHLFIFNIQIHIHFSHTSFLYRLPSRISNSYSWKTQLGLIFSKFRQYLNFPKSHNHNIKICRIILCLNLLDVDLFLSYHFTNEVILHIYMFRRSWNTRILHT